MPQSPAPENNADEIDLGALLNAWWKQRGRLALHALGAGVLAFTAVVLIYFFQPSLQQSSVLVRLEFKGAEDGRYPNGMRFSPGDLIATPVLQEVYRRNQLEAFVTFADFKNSLSVINRNPAVDRLRREFAGKLEQKNLSAVDREKLEADFQNRLQGARNSEFTLVLVYDGKLNRWPADLAGKVLEDSLKVWAEQARDKGVFTFEQDLYSVNIVLDIKSAGGDYNLFADRLRLAIQRIMSNLDELDKLSGARLLRVGPNQRSLGEMRASLQDSLTFDLRELNAIIFNFGLFRQPKLTEAYLKEQLFRIGLERRELQSTNDGLATIVASYNSGTRVTGYAQNSRANAVTPEAAAGLGSGGYVPQLSDGFLDRIIDLSGQKADISFRQELARRIIENEQRLHNLESEQSLYQRSLESLTSGRVSNGGRTPEGTMTQAEAEQLVDKQLNRLMERLANTTNEIAMLHRELSAANLEPSKVYRVIQPLAQEELSSFSLVRALGAAGGLACAYVGMVFVLTAIRGAKDAR